MRLCEAKQGQSVVVTRGQHRGSVGTIDFIEKYGVIVSLWFRPEVEPFFLTAEMIEPYLVSGETTESAPYVPDFNAGDRVRYVGNVNEYRGDVGVVRDVSRNAPDDVTRLEVKFDNHAIAYVAPAQWFEPVTETAVYAGKPNLVHIPNGKRQGVGRLIANAADALIREAALRSDGEDGDLYNPLCPGCYMVAIFNAAVALAEANGQSLTELGRCMAKAFNELETKGISAREDIEVTLDHC